MFAFFFSPLFVGSSHKLAPGPYGLLFALLVHFFFDIPVSTLYNVLRFHFSDKSLICIAAIRVKKRLFLPFFVGIVVSIVLTCFGMSHFVFQLLLLSCWITSLLPGICGIVAGLWYRLNAFYVRKIKVSEVLCLIFVFVCLFIYYDNS